MKQSQLIVIGGGSGNGKSEIMIELHKRGYNTYKEPAREFLEKRVRQQTKEAYENPTPEENIYRQTEIYKRVIQQENKLRQIPGTHIIERSAIEGIVFNEMLLGYQLPITKQYPPGEYAIILIPDPLEFENDGIRIEKNEAQARKIHDGIIAKYFHHGYRPHRIPLMQGSKQEQIELRTEHAMKIAAQNGLLDNVYTFQTNSDYNERLAWMYQNNFQPTKIYDKIYSKMLQNRPNKVYSLPELGKMLQNLSTDLQNDPENINLVLQTMEKQRIIKNIQGGDN